MRLAVLLPDGVGIRNFLLGGFLRQPGGCGEVWLPSGMDEGLRETFRGLVGDGYALQTLQPYGERPLAAFLRYSLAYAQMYWGDSQAMRHVRCLPVTGSWRRQALHRSAKALGRSMATPRGIQWLDTWHCREVARRPVVEFYRQAFARDRPDVLFCSHQRPPVVLPAVLAARSLEIPTATFIFSWDNLTSKGRIAAPFDHYLVWSDLMRKECLRYYPDVSEERVHVAGTPQFDPYADEELAQTRDEFFRSFGADPSRPLICYSGGDHGTCPDDPEHARVLLEHVRAERIRKNPQVLVRPSPVDDGTRYDALRRDFPEMIFARPAWVHANPGDWSRVFPLPEDVRFLANLTRHADLNVNLASTMTLDFAIRDKPVVNVAFDVVSPPRFGRPYWDFYYRFEHYRPVVELGAARFARTADELADHVNAYLDDPSLDCDARRRFVELEVGRPIGHSSEVIAEALRAIAQGAAFAHS